MVMQPGTPACPICIDTHRYRHAMLKSNAFSPIAGARNHNPAHPSFQEH